MNKRIGKQNEHQMTYLPGFLQRHLSEKPLISFLVSVILTFWLFVPSTLAREIVVIESGKECFSLGPFVEILEDKGGNLSLDDVMSEPYSSDFFASQSDSPGFGFTSSVYWIRWTVLNQSVDNIEWFLEISYPLLDEIKLYVPAGEKDFSVVPAGDLALFADRPFIHQNFVFPLSEPPGSRTYYLRVETESSMNIPMVLWTRDSLFSAMSKEQIIQGMYYGIMLIMLVYNLFVFLSTRDVNFLFYVLFIGSFTLISLSLNGLGFRYLWPNILWLCNSPPFFMAHGSIWALIFSRSFLNIPAISPRLDKLVHVMIAVNFTMMALSYLLPYNVSIRVVVLLTMAGIIVMLVIGIYSAMKGVRAAKFYLLAWFSAMMGVFLTSLKNMGVIPGNFITVWGFQFGTAFQMFLFSLGLADKINIMQEEKFLAERNAVENLKKVDKLKDEFLANTSHELRTPLNGIIGLAESLIDGAAGRLPDKVRSNLAMITASGKRLASLVDDILDFSRLKNRDISLRLRPVDLRQLVNVVLTVLYPLTQGKNIVLKNEIPEDIPTVLGDENRLQQILNNLVGNAIKFTNDGEIEISGKESGTFVEITVRDTGIGIPQDKCERIFLSFEQADASTAREYGGTGLGLSITKHLVELHGGKISVDSEPGSGSVFTISIPQYSEAHVKPVTEEGISRKRELQLIKENIVVDAEITSENEKFIADFPHTILIVDDEVVNLQVLANHLKLKNYGIKQAVNGEEALRIFSDNGKPDLVLLDVMMPRMSGYEVCTKLREKFSASELPIIMLTAKNQVRDLIEGFNVGANDYITKPFSKNELLARIKTHLYLTNVNKATRKFVPYEFLHILGRESILDINLGDQAYETMTILFSDIRSYTTMSETMTPKENFDFLNGLLRRIGPIFREQNGFVNQYYGDGVMALFPHSPENALVSAIKMQKRISEYNKTRIRKARKAIQIGVGIQIGTLMLGILGDKERLSQNVVSDAVNTAARLEGLTKTLGASIIISEDIVHAIDNINSYTYRFLGKVKAKGKNQAVSIFEILDGESEQLIARKKQTAEDFNNGLEYYRKACFQEAITSFTAVLDKHPEDKAAAFYFEQSRLLQKLGVQDSWTGVVSIQVK